MSASKQVPSFDDRVPFLNQFILELLESYKSDKIISGEDLDRVVKTFFTPGRMLEIEDMVPGWHKMASYDDGVTLVHVMCVFMGLYMMPEFLGMSKVQQQMMKWVIFLHDVEKESQSGKRDHAHAFRSAAAAARILPNLGFPTTSKYDSFIDNWTAFTCTAITVADHSLNAIQDNCKLPEILSGVDHMFGYRTPATLIIKTILFHLSVDMQLWPPAAPLTDDEVKGYFDRDLVPMLRVMNLGDSEGWSMFDASREVLRKDTLEAFMRIERLILAK